MRQTDILSTLFRLFEKNGIATQGLTVNSQMGSPDVEIDSVRFMKLFVDLENDFDIEIDYLDAMQGTNGTIGALISYLQDRLPTGDGR